jgi:hypothetical protein
MSEDRQRVEQTASAIEDLLYMEAIRLGDSQDKALLSPQFSLIVSNVMSSMKIKDETGDDVMKLMYYSLLIYMNERLKMPRLPCWPRSGPRTGGSRKNNAAMKIWRTAGWTSPAQAAGSPSRSGP